MPEVKRVIGHGSIETWFDDHLGTWFEGILNGDMVRLGKNGIMRHGSKVHRFQTRTRSKKQVKFD